MDSEAEIIIAFVFKRSGKKELKGSEIYLPLSIDLGWFSTKEAQNFVNYAVNQKFLIKKKDLLAPSFDVEKITIPIGFYPSKPTFVEGKKDLKEEKSNVIDAVMHRISEKTNQDPKDIAEEIKQIELDKKILPEAATLFAAKKYNIDLEDFFEPIKNKILRESGE